MRARSYRTKDLSAMALGRLLDTADQRVFLAKLQRSDGLPCWTSPSEG